MICVAQPYFTVFRSPAEDNGFIAAGGDTAQLWSMIRAVLDFLARTRNCSRTAIHKWECLAANVIFSKTSAVNLVNIK